MNSKTTLNVLKNASKFLMILAFQCAFLPLAKGGEKNANEIANRHLKSTYIDIQNQKNLVESVQQLPTPGVDGSISNQNRGISSKSFGVVESAPQNYQDPEVYDDSNFNSQVNPISEQIEREISEVANSQHYSELYKKELLRQIRQKALESGYRVEIEGLTIKDVQRAQ